jgi:lipid-binding SYLF domain-containing protein
MKALFSCVTAILLAQFIGGQAVGQTRAALDDGIAETVKQFNLLDTRHPELLQRAAGVLVFPNVTKGGIALASEYGEGALQVDGETVDYYRVASASVGLTAGMASHREVIVFKTADALDQFRRSKGWSIGANAGIAVISAGTADDYASARYQKPVLVFVFGEKGLIADLSLQGSKINKITK